MECKKNKQPQLLCKKNDVHLYKMPDNDGYRLYFTIQNPRINIKTLLNDNIYELITKLNPDFFEDFKIIQEYDDNSKDIYVSFHSFGKELGIQKKIMFINLKKCIYGNEIHFIGKHITKENQSKHHDVIEHKHSIIKINFINSHFVEIDYKFNVDIKEDLPIYMENMIGIIMKKIYLNLKTFIENSNK
jgi:hypothetical protein